MRPAKRQKTGEVSTFGNISKQPVKSTDQSSKCEVATSTQRVEDGSKQKSVKGKSQQARSYASFASDTGSDVSYISTDSSEPSDENDLTESDSDASKISVAPVEKQMQDDLDSEGEYVETAIVAVSKKEVKAKVKKLIVSSREKGLRTHYNICERVLADNLNTVEDRNNGIDPPDEELLTEDEGGYFMLERDSDGDIVDKGQAGYFDEKHKLKLEKRSPRDRSKIVNQPFLNKKGERVERATDETDLPLVRVVEGNRKKAYAAKVKQKKAAKKARGAKREAKRRKKAEKEAEKKGTKVELPPPEVFDDAEDEADEDYSGGSGSE